MKRNKSLIGFLMVCLVFMSSFLISFDSKAAVFEEYVDYAEPATSDTQGYISFLIKDNKTGNNKLMTFFWYCVGVSQHQIKRLFIRLLNSKRDILCTLHG